MKQNTLRLLSFVLAFLLIAASATLASCTKKQEDPTTEAPQSEAGENAPASSEAESEQSPDKEAKNELGEGKTTFLFEVIDQEGKQMTYTIHTDQKTVGDALTELGLIEGDDGAYGLYVKKVCGILADYDADQTYWSFYIDGEYAMSGVDKTEIENGATYTLKVEKG